MDLLDPLGVSESTGNHTTGCQVPTRSGTTMASMVGAFFRLILSLPLIYSAGLIRFKIVIHGFIDGKSRLITGIRASNNNRASTVLDVFLSAIEVHGTPSRVRGDHGTENLEVAEWMEEHAGPNRGSYIWGK